MSQFARSKSEFTGEKLDRFLFAAAKHFRDLADIARAVKDEHAFSRHLKTKATKSKRECGHPTTLKT
jgi:hypothetical protein